MQGHVVRCSRMRTRLGWDVFFVLEHEETMHGEVREVARRLWLCEVRDGRITDVVGYCNGGWDDALRARHAAEAPMVRP